MPVMVLANPGAKVTVKKCAEPYTAKTMPPTVTYVTSMPPTGTPVTIVTSMPPTGSIFVRGFFRYFVFVFVV